MAFADRRLGAALAAAAAVALLVAASGASAQTTASRTSIYSCLVDGKRIRSDRPIPECMSRDQQELNNDGSVKRVVPPVPTADERAAIEQRQRDADAKRLAEMSAVRRDSDLMRRYPNEGAHRKVREKALDDIRSSVKSSEARIALVMKERKKLLDEAEFYKGKSLPPLLKQQLDANDAALEAQRSLVQNQQTEMDRINAIYDVELERLRKLWKGAPPGSLGSAPGPQAAAAPATPIHTSLK